MTSNNNIDKENDRRDFLKKASLSTVPFLFPAIGSSTISMDETLVKTKTEDSFPVNFMYDGLDLPPKQYIEKLQEIDNSKSIEADYYGNGGATKALEEEFAKITGKEKAIYLPTGTMANQLAIKLLNENNTKVIVPENSHVFRDEADAAQSVHGKRLIPVGKGKPYFEANDVMNTIEYTNNNEVFKSGLGTVVIENPVRRADGTFVPIETIKEISNYCKQNNYKMHLDGARIHLASAYSNIEISEYASFFDTVYISLYKYLHAAGGAILCGNAEIIDQISHQIKILGGTIFQSWTNTSMALHYLNGIEERWDEVILRSENIISELNKIRGISFTKLQNGTNIYYLQGSDGINFKKLALFLYSEHNIWLRQADKKGIVKFVINESLMTRDSKKIIDAWKIGAKLTRD